MSGSGTSTFIDPDDYQASLDRVPLDLLLATSRGEFKACVTSARLNHLYLLSSEEDFPRIAYVSLSPALVFVGFPTRSSPPIVWGGVELNPGRSCSTVAPSDSTGNGRTLHLGSDRARGGRVRTGPAYVRMLTDKGPPRAR